MSAIKIANDNLSIRSISSVLAIVVFLLIVGGVASFFHHPAVLGGMGLSFVTTVVFATLMTLWFIKKSVSNLGINVTDIEKKATFAFIIYHIICLIIIFSSFYFYNPKLTIDMLIGYSSSIFTLLLVSFISKV